MVIGNRWAKILVLAGLAVALNVAGHWLAQVLNFQVFPRHEPMLHMIVLIAATLYILLMAVPFMPGIEIGLALLVLLGGEGALLVYLSTVLSLSLSYGLGRLMPGSSISGLLSWLHFARASELARQMERQSPSARLDLLYRRVPGNVLPFVLRHRFVAVAVLLNLPGNALIGGGGGIGMVLGMSRLIPYYQYLLTMALAVAPVPLLFYLTGI
ncbi:hypothetical protein [Marinobacter sp. SS21]|uniref:hypothetical protein n=1 Tax=Marinobacter sp. SS21 TaxID=2979460 RepID=UPI00232E0F8E|nr:hypothetical protein [Marinobacter sp. SS21]MDC0663939.1 hypothetical protein [Marinobacter sp. SS21]